MRRNSKQNNSVEGGDGLTKGMQTNDIESDMSDDEHHTCGHRDNIFTPKHEIGKRIDFILFRLFDRKIDSNESLAKKLCEVKHQTISCKDENGLSFSDHQPVVALFKIRCSEQKTTSRRIDDSDNQSKHELSDEKTNSNDEKVSMASGNEKTNCLLSRRVLNGGGSLFEKKLHEKSGDGIHLAQDSKPKLKLNILPKVTESGKIAKTGPLQLKHMASNAILLRLQSISSNREQYLEITKHLLQDYINENQLTLKLFLFVLLSYLMILSLIGYSLSVFTLMTKTGIFLSTFFLSIVFFLGSFLKLLSSRHEKNAIKSIVNDIENAIVLKQ